MLHKIRADKNIWSLCLYACIMLVLAGIAFYKFHSFMDVYEKFILICTPFIMTYLAYVFKPWRYLSLITFALSLVAIYIYHNNLANAQHVFLLKYFLASQTAIIWMTFCIFSSTLCYLLGLWRQTSFIYKCARQFAYIAIIMGSTGMLVRWFESYLIAIDIGHIPISNLYEVFILFCIITLILYVYYETKYKTYALGAFSLPIIASANSFLIWYAMARSAHEIAPLVPALQSWWMKIHVPANFIGYGAFSLAAMLAIAYLLRYRFENEQKLDADIDTDTLSWINKLPSKDIIDDMMYKAISLGFAFFTLATILGALWAAEAWGGYWSWDPKETWALIVWLNYAAWLHMRLVGGWRGNILAWWAIVGLFVTLFAFMGVNLFLAGFHSYGTL
jgi:cytochrome c-type biogenesis protein CcsB